MGFCFWLRTGEALTKCSSYPVPGSRVKTLFLRSENILLCATIELNFMLFS
jgi:hypothetical protein